MVGVGGAVVVAGAVVAGGEVVDAAVVGAVVPTAVDTTTEVAAGRMLGPESEPQPANVASGTAMTRAAHVARRHPPMLPPLDANLRPLAIRDHGPNGSGCRPGLRRSRHHTLVAV